MNQLNAKSIVLGQRFANRKLVNNTKDVIPFAGSIKTAYRRLADLKSLGIIKQSRGRFNIKSGVISQPAYLLDRLLPSLLALKSARRFGKYYNDADIEFVKKNLDFTFITLDYKAWELTEFQFPSDLFVYVKDLNRSIAFLKENKFREGKKGHIVLLPETGNFDNIIERVYFDCIANDGRSMLDAIALDIKYGDQIRTKGLFSIDNFKKVEEDMPNYTDAFSPTGSTKNK